MTTGIGGFSQELVKAGILVGLGLIVLAQFLTVGTSTAASNTAITSFITGIGQIPTWIPILVVVFMAVIIYAWSSGVGRR